VFFEEHARFLLLLHTALAVAAVAASTHLVLWLWKLRRGASGKLRAVRRFGVIVACLHLGAFVAGNLMYPTYKVRVKLGYLQSEDAVSDDATTRAARADRDHLPPPPEMTPEDAGQAAKWFDAKEHWVALGLPVLLLLALLLAGWPPDEGREIGGVIFGMALFACATLWFAALVGVVTASWRAVG